MRTRQSLSVAAIILLLLAGTALPAQAQVNVYVKINGVSGDSMESNHKGWTEARAFSYEVGLPDPELSVSSGTRRPQAEGNTLVVCKGIDSGTADLFMRLVCGTHISTATIDVCVPVGTANRLMLRLEMSDVHVTRMETIADSENGGQLLEQVQLTFGSLKLTTCQYDSSGKLSGQNSRSHNFQ